MSIDLGGWRAAAHNADLAGTARFEGGELVLDLGWDVRLGRPSAVLLVPLLATASDDRFFLLEHAGKPVRRPEAAQILAKARPFATPPDTPIRVAGLPWPGSVHWALPVLIFRSNTPLFRSRVQYRIDDWLARATGPSDAATFKRDFAAEVGANDFEKALEKLASQPLSALDIAVAAAEFLRMHSPLARGCGPVRRP